MIKNLTAITLVLFSLSAKADEKGLFDRYFKLIPESEALLVSGLPKERELPARTLKALIWNIKKAQFVNWKEEFQKFSEGQDLILIQEAFNKELFTSTLSSIEGFLWNMGVSFLYRSYGDTPTGTIVGSTVEPTQVEVKHSPDLEPVVSTPKAITVVRYPVQQKNEELLVISVHGINVHTTGAFMRQMDDAVEAIRNHSGPVVFAGDFNTWNASRSGYLKKLCDELNLKDVEFINGHLRMKFRGYYLDHIFVRGVEVKHAEVKASNGSDHQPLFLELEII
jgi:endonuclease/exonuclease/phosphatase (EEP) superfamily protein YafD